MSSIRVDAIKLCHATQRPFWTPMADIGSWFTVLNILGFVAIITNPSMIAFAGYNLVRDEDKELSIGGISVRLETTYLWIYAIGCVAHAGRCRSNKHCRTLNHRPFTCRLSTASCWHGC